VREKTNSAAPSLRDFPDDTGPRYAPGFVSACCDGERCFCGRPAHRKIEEAFFFDDPDCIGSVFGAGGIELGYARHPLTAYVCFDHFVQLMGPAALSPPVAGSEVLEKEDLDE
jgi:hypothetical protein